MMPTQPIRLLHLEDDALDCELVEAALAADSLAPLEFVRVSTEAQFLSALSAGGFDLVLADYALPGYDGISALDAAQVAAPDVPFIFVTGALGEEQAIETLKRGATDYVYKNRLTRLGPAVRRALAEAGARVAQHRAQAGAQAEREWLRVTLASIGDAVIATDTAGRVTFMNSVAERLTGWGQAEAAGQPIETVFSIVGEADQQPVPSPVRLAIASGATEGLQNHTLLVPRAGSPVPIDDSAAPIRDGEGRLLGVVLVFRDVTARRLAEQALERRARQQAVVGELGHLALASRDMAGLMDEAVRRVAETLGVELVKVLELQPDRQNLLIRAGVGWAPGVVGETLVPNAPLSHAGYTLQANAPVITADLRHETRFAGMPVLHEHGVISGLTVPIPGQQQPYGVLGAHCSRPRAFTPDDANFVQAVANVLAEALARHRVEDSLRALTLRLDRALVEAELLNAMATAISGEADLERLLPAALQHLGRAISFTGGSIALVEGDELVIRAAVGPFAQIALGQRQRRGTGASWRVVDKGEPLVNNDLSSSPLSATTPIQSYLAVPLTWRGASLGLLEIDSTRSGAFSDTDLLLMQRAATLMSGAVAIAQQYADTQRAHQQAEAARMRLGFVAEASTRLSTSLDQADVCERVMALVVPCVAEAACLLWQPEAGEAAVVTHAHADAAQQPALARLAAACQPHRGNLLGQALATGQPVLISQLTPALVPSLVGPGEPAEALAPLGVRSAMVVPLKVRDQVQGALWLLSTQAERHFTPDDLALAEELGRRTAAALENARLFAEARTLNAELEQRVVERTAQVQAAHDRLRASERLLAEAQEIAELGSWQWEVATGRVTGSPEFYRIFGVDPGRFAGTFGALLELVHPADRDAVESVLRRACELGVPYTLDHRIVRPDGQARVLHARGEVTAHGPSGARVLTSVALDITERQAIEDELRASREELRQLSGHLQAAREEERTRMAREIHDELGGAMTAIKMEVNRLAKNAATVTPEQITERTAALFGLIDSTVKTIRRMATDLRPPLLDDFGLVAAIEWQLQEFGQRAGLECVFDAAVDEVPIDRDGATGIFRVFQETLTNVARHAQASRVDVQLELAGGHLVLRTRDNGRGISERELTGSRSLGLVGMRERVRLLRGELVISGKPGAGTTVLVRVPLAAEPA